MEPLGGDRWQLKVKLPSGVFPYKFIMDDHWSYDADLQTQFDGDNTNNVADVVPFGIGERELAARDRILSDGGLLTGEEQDRMLKMMLPHLAV